MRWSTRWPHADGLSLGVHFTRTLWGTVLVGPTASYVAEKTDYERDRLPLEDFWRSALTLLPELKLEDLRLAYSGLRPKLVPPDGHGIADFVVESATQDARVRFTWSASSHPDSLPRPQLPAT